MIHQFILLCAVATFAVSAWQSSTPAWPRIVSVGLTLLAASLVNLP